MFTFLSGRKKMEEKFQASDFPETMQISYAHENNNKENRMLREQS